MSSLMYRPDMDEVRKRLTLWWNGGDIGRPVMLFTSHRETPWENIPEMPKPEGWITDYATHNFEYRVNLSARACLHSEYHGEAVPLVSPDLAPNCLALYLGCKGVDMPGTVWCEHCMKNPEDAKFEYDPENFYWKFTQKLCREQLRLGKNKFMLHFPEIGRAHV